MDDFEIDEEALSPSLARGPVFADSVAIPEFGSQVPDVTIPSGLGGTTNDFMTEKVRRDDPLFQVLADQNLGRDQRTMEALDALRLADPDKYSEAMRLSKIEGLPSDLVYRNVDQFKDREKLSTARRILSTNEKLRDWFAEGDNARAVDVDDLKRLEGVKWLTHSAAAAFHQGSHQTRMLELGNKELFGKLSDDETRELETLRTTAPNDYGKLGWVGEGYTLGVEQIPTMGSIIGESLKGAGKGGILFGAGAVMLGFGAPAAVGIMGAGLAAGAWSHGSHQSFVLNSGEAWLEYKDMKDVDGKPLDRDLARGGAVIVGAINAGMDALGAKFLLKSVPGFEQFASMGAKNAVKRLLKDQTFRSIAISVGKRYGQSVGMESVTEAAQEAVKIFGGDALKFASGQKFDPSDPYKQAAQIGEAFRQAMLASVFLVGAGSSSTLAFETAQARRATVHQRVLEGLAKQAQNDPMVKRDPVKAAAAMHSVIEGSGKESVFIESDKFQELMQDEEMGRWVLQIPAIQEKVNEALLTGKPVEIPTSDFYVHVMSRKGFEVHADSVRFSVEGVDLKEATAINEAIEGIKKSWADQEAMLANPLQGPVYQDVVGQAKALGYKPEQAASIASMYEHFFISIAAATNQDAEKLFKEWNISIVNQDLAQESDPAALLQKLDLAKSLENVKIDDDTTIEWSAPEDGSEREFKVRRAGKEKPGFGTLWANPETGGMEMAVIDIGGLRNEGERGLGPKIYDAAEAAVGAKIVPSISLSNEAYKMWLRRDPAAVEGKYLHQGEDGWVRIENPDMFNQESDKLLDDLFVNFDELDPRGVTSPEVLAEILQSAKDALNHNTKSMFRKKGKVASLVRKYKNNATFQNLVRLAASIDGLYSQLSRWDASDRVIDILDGLENAKTSWAKLEEAAESDRNLESKELTDEIEKLKNADIVDFSTIRELNEELKDLELMLPHVHKQFVDLQQSIKDLQEQFEKISPEDREIVGEIIAIEKIIAENGEMGVDAKEMANAKEIAEQHEENVKDLHQIIRLLENPDTFNQTDVVKGVGFLQELLGNDWDGKLRRGKKNDPAGDTSMRPHGLFTAVYEEQALEFSTLNPPSVQDIEKFNLSNPLIIHLDMGGEAAFSLEETKAAADKMGLDVKTEDQLSEFGPNNPYKDALFQHLIEKVLPNIKNSGVYDGVIFVTPDNGSLQPGVEVLLFDDVKFNQTGEGGRVTRGSITFKDDATVIKLFKHQNMSTLLHETGHLFLQVMAETVNDPNVTVSNDLKVDFKTLQAWLGEEGPKFSTEAHETFARSFEAYLMEGRAPTAELEKAFDRFKAWLKATYRRLSNLGVTVPEPVKGVFDRMLVGAEAIDYAQRLHGLEPLWSTAEEAQMSQPAFDKYIADLTEVKSQAERQLDAKIMGDYAATQSQEAAEIRQRVRGDVTDELSTQQVYRAMEFLKRGAPGIEPMKLDREEVKKTLGENGLKSIPGGSSMWTVSKKKIKTISDEAKLAAGQLKVVRETIKDAAKVMKALNPKFDVDKEVKSAVAKLRSRTDFSEKTLKQIRPTGRLPRGGVAAWNSILAVAVEQVTLERAIKEGTQVEEQVTQVVHPDVAAAMFGYENGADMLAEFQRVPPLKTAIDQEVEARVKTETEQLLETTPAVEQQANIESKNEMYRDYIRFELKHLAKLMAIDFDEHQIKAMPAAARLIVRSRKFGDALRATFASSFVLADRKLNKMIAEAAKKKDYAQVLDLRLKQLLNSYMGEEASKAHHEAKSMKKYGSKFKKDMVRVIDQEYLSQIRAVLINYGFMKGQIDPGTIPLSQFLDDEIRKGQSVVVDPSISKPKKAKPVYTNLTIDEVAAIRDTLGNLEYMGREKTKLVKDANKTTVIAASAQIVAALRKNIAPLKRSGKLTPDLLDRFKDTVRSMTVNSLIKIEQLADWIDAGKVNGPAHRFIFQPIAAAQHRESAMAKEFSEKVLEIIERKPRSYYRERVIIRSLNGQSMSRNELLAVALNVGNESNLGKLKKGYDWNDAQIAEMLDNLDEKDWKSVQDIWNIIDLLWPDIRDLQHRMSRKRPDKVIATPVQTKFGEFQGGYYPVVYDPAKAPDVKRRGMRSVAEEHFGLEPHTVFPTPGFAKDRANDFAAPMLLDLSVLPTHLQRVIHFITHTEAASDVSKIILNKEFSEEMNMRFGSNMIEVMDQWLKHVTRGDVPVQDMRAWHRIGAKLRRNTTLLGLGFRATTALMQTGGWFAGAEMIGVAATARGIMGVFNSIDPRDVMANIQDVRKKSGEMRHRMQFLERDLNHIGVAVSQVAAWREKAQYAAMLPIAVMDAIVATSVWQGAYEKALEAKHSEHDAIQYADKVIRLTQGTGAPKDMAAVQRSSEFFKWMSMFYTYFSAMQNRMMDVGRQAKGTLTEGGEQNYEGLDRPNAAVRWFLLVIAPSIVLDTIMRGAIKGELDDDKFYKKAMLRALAYNFAGVPMVRDVVNFALREEDHFRFQMSPVSGSVQRVLDHWDKLARGKRGRKPEELLRLGTDTAGIALGVPGIDALSIPIWNALRAQHDGQPFGVSDMLVRRKAK